MIVTTAVFTCSICGEPSTEICAYCTKDACGNHRCVRCKRCSDCCECEFPLSAEEVAVEELTPEPELAHEAAPEAEALPVDEPGVTNEPPSDSIDDLNEPPV